MKREELLDNIHKRLKISILDENIDRLTLEQMEFITHDINIPCYLEACPGSGKTEVVGIKAAYEISYWKENFVGMAFLSFTNTAANEIDKRAKKYAGSSVTGHAHFIGTFDSFFYKYILCPFFHGFCGYSGKQGDYSPRSIVDERSDAAFLNNEKYQAKTAYAIPNPNKKAGAPLYVGMRISSNRFYFDVLKNDFCLMPPVGDLKRFMTLSDMLKRPEQQEYLQQYRWLTVEKIIEGFWAAKKSFWKDGFLTFRDCEFIVINILVQNDGIKRKLIKRFPYLIIDECQDLSPMQLIILQYLIEGGMKVHFIGDLNQSIYKFREVRPKDVLDFITKQGLIKLPLTNNFRSNQNIVDVFEKIYPGNILGKENKYLEKCLHLIEYTEDEIPKLTKRYQEIIRESKLEFSKNYKDIKVEFIRDSRSAIIMRGTSLLNKFRPFKTDSNNALTKFAIALQLWNSQPKDSVLLNHAVSLFGNFLSQLYYERKGNSRNQYCPEGISGANWRISLATLMNQASKTLFPFLDQNGDKLTYSEWAKIVRRFIPTLYASLPVKAFVEVDQVKIIAEHGLGSTEVETHVIKYKSGSNLRATTIHDVKGETLDSVMIVSSIDKKSKGGHWKHWFTSSTKTEDEEEHKRYGYVAFSRPKHLLVLAVPPLDPTDRKTFSDYGFVVEDLKTKPLF